ncbi:MAG: hypothetical protein U0234_27895 [Sandaracinus sp.]
MISRLVWSIVLAGLFLAGCHHATRVGAFGDDAFYLVRDHYRIDYVDGRRDVMSDAWTLENFQLTESGVGDAKWTPEYTRSLHLDENDDGRSERAQVVERYDLRYSHRSDGTLLFAQTTPVPSRAADRDLEVVAHDFVDRVGGASYFEVDWSAQVVTARRNATVLREEGPVTVDGVPGYWVTFDIVSLDQREADASHQGERVTIVLARPMARWTPSVRPYSPDAQDGWPMLVMFGYASRVEHHDTHRAEFEDLLRRIDFHETP